MYKKVTTVTEEYSDYPDEELEISPVRSNEGPPKKYAPCIRADVPLMIKLLEESNPNHDLHILTSRMLQESEDGKVLTMSDYESLMNVEEIKTV